MVPKVVPACQTPATDGTIFVTDSEKVRAARAMVEEDLLIRHPIDCPICDKAGECRLQDYHFQHGRAERRADLRPFTSRRRPMGDTVTLFVDRCVMCTRCVRFTREITGTAELMVIDRGSHEEIDIFPGYPLANRMSGNVVDLCPVGALGDTDFLYSQRVWFMQPRASVCDRCSTGCSTLIHENQDHIYRVTPRENPHVNQWWICDEGRYGFRHVHRPDRLTQPGHRRDGQRVALEWNQVYQMLPAELERAGHLAAVISPYLTVEESYLLCQYVRQLDPQALLAMGPIPVVGDDEKFPNGFTIRAEKCPNRRGVEAILARWQGEVITWEDFLLRFQNETPGGLWITGGYPVDWIDETTASHLAGVPLLIVQDLFPSPLWERATIQLPGVATAERSGSFVNHQGRLQAFEWAVRPPAGSVAEGQVYWQLLGRSGLYQAALVRGELGRANAHFASALGEVSPLGVDLKIDQLADEAPQSATLGATA
jgi:NADH-quinone oxidoreductase subunit G